MMIIHSFNHFYVRDFLSHSLASAKWLSFSHTDDDSASATYGSDANDDDDDRERVNAVKQLGSAHSTSHPRLEQKKIEFHL